MIALELLENMKQNMEGVNTISVPYHISQINDGIAELEALRTENAKLTEILAREIDDGRAEVDDIGVDAWIAKALKGE